MDGPRRRAMVMTSIGVGGRFLALAAAIMDGGFHVMLEVTALRGLGLAMVVTGFAHGLAAAVMAGGARDVSGVMAVMLWRRLFVGLRRRLMPVMMMVDDGHRRGGDRRHAQDCGKNDAKSVVHLNL
ncbi:MAG TPA: hypothetical protein VG166_03010 [Caulobacteraceae bacterium]|nr:hypothetical protein [Caulobacteraceae bacterium]